MNRTKTIEWNKDKGCLFLGRNGEGYCRALEITNFSDMPKPFITFYPVTSQGKTGRCRIEIPADPDILNEMSAILLNIATNIRNK